MKSKDFKFITKVKYNLYYCYDRLYKTFYTFNK